MAIKELFYDQRPVALINPRSSRRIDPRFTFTRQSEAYYVNDEGNYTLAASNTPRFSYDFNTGEFGGLWIESLSTNLILNSVTSGAVVGAFGSGGLLPTGWSVGQQQPGCVLSIVATGIEKGLNYVDLRFSGTATGVNKFLIQPSGSASNTISVLAGDTQTTSIYAKLVSGTLPTGSYSLDFVGLDLKQIDSTLKFYSASTTYGVNSTIIPRIVVGTNKGVSYDFTVRLACPQIEDGFYGSSPIITTGTTKTRQPDLLSVNSINIPDVGSAYIDATTLDTTTGNTLFSLKNASNQKINLAIEERPELFNSPALVYSIQGVVRPTLPFPVPTSSRERNIITWGANNYQYGASTARFAQSLSSSVPPNLTTATIGHDSVDPTVGYNGYINAVYIYSGEITPTVAEALVRNELDPVNADGFVPVSPAGALTLIINTQGAAGDGDREFQLPAESVANDNDIVINWGDQTESGLENAAAELPAIGLTKTYAAAGIYSVFITGKLENLKFNNSSSAGDLVEIVRWGTSADGNDVYLSPSTLREAFYNCAQLNFSSTARTSNLPDTSQVTDWYRSFRGCSSITGTFPSFNFSAATDFDEAFRSCTSLTGFPAVGNQTQNVTNFSQAWQTCSALTAFPAINTSSGTNFNSAWRDCSSLTEFPNINTSEGTSFVNTWLGCTLLGSAPGLPDFPTLNMSKALSVNGAWQSCPNLTEFPVIDMPLCTSFRATWTSCTGLTQFPLINVSSGQDFTQAWNSCTSLTAFLNLDTSNALTLASTWRLCTSLVNFAAIDTSSCTDFRNTWQNCIVLNPMPQIDTSQATNVSGAWRDCNSLVDFPELNFDNVVGAPGDSGDTGFANTWLSCNSLTNFPANRFDSTTCTRFTGAFTGCNLSVQSIENILVSLVTAGQNGGDLDIDGGGNASKSTWSTAANNAYNTLTTSRGWTIDFKP
jgi:hypothetical protein